MSGFKPRLDDKNWKVRLIHACQYQMAVHLWIMLNFKFKKYQEKAMFRIMCFVGLKISCCQSIVYLLSWDSTGDSGLVNSLTLLEIVIDKSPFKILKMTVTSLLNMLGFFILDPKYMSNYSVLSLFWKIVSDKNVLSLWKFQFNVTERRNSF